MRIYAVAFLAAASCAVANPHRIRKGHARRIASSTSHGRVLQKEDAQAKDDLMSLSMSFPDTTEAPLVTEASGKNDGEDAMSMPPAETTEAPIETTDASAEGVMSAPPGKEQETDDEMSMPVETTEAPGKEDGPADEMSMPAGPVDTTEAPGKEQETDDDMSMPVETTEAPGKEDGPDDEMSMPSPPVGTTEVPLSTGTTSFAVTTSSPPIDVESLPDEILSMSMPETTESDSSSDVDANMSVDSSTVDATQAPEDVDEEGPAGDDKFTQEADPVISNIEKSSSVVLGSRAAAIAITGAMMFI
ncbi:hypothetical protein ACHAW6_009088 [Cyclotella cf. meneghiniana]